MKINHAVEVANILKHNLVQGSRAAGDDAARWGTFFLTSWSLLLGVHATAANNGIELNIHEDIERGDNDSVKIGGKNVKVDKPCSA